MRQTLRLTAVAALAAATLVGNGAGAQPQRPGVTERISVTSAGAQGNDASGDGQAQIAVTPDARYVAFSSKASNLVSGDLNNQADVFVHDRRTGKTVMASVPSPGTVAQATGTGLSPVCPAQNPAISANGRYVAFDTCRVLDGKTPDIGGDVWLHDLATGTTTRVSVAYDSKPLLGASMQPSISVDGRYVAFASEAAGLVRDTCPGDTVAHELCVLLGAHEQIYVRDMVRRTTTLVSVSTAGAATDGDAYNPSISPDGHLVVFTTAADNLVSNDHNACTETVPTCADVYVRDLRASVTQLVSVGLDGQAATAVPFLGDGAGTDSSSRVVSADDRYVAFESGQTGLVPADAPLTSTASNGEHGMYVRDLRLQRTERVSVTSSGEPMSLGLGAPSIDATGRYVTFDAVEACGSGVTTSSWSVAIHDRVTGETRLLDRVNSSGVENPCTIGYTSSEPVVSAAGRYVAFASTAANLVRGDTNKTWDVFVRDRGTALGVGSILATAHAAGKPAAGFDALGLHLTDAAVVYRPALAGMPPLALAGPSVRYVVSLVSHGVAYQLRISDASFILFRSSATGWQEVGAVSGGYGTTGLQVVAAIPLRLLGLKSPAALGHIQAMSQLVSAAGGDATTVDVLTLTA